MKLFVDESLGTHVPRALSQLCPFESISVEWVLQKWPRPMHPPANDEKWITYVGRSPGTIGISSDMRILRTESAMEAIRREKAGIVLVASGQEPRVKLMILLLKKLGWFRELNQLQRPFIFIMKMSGKSEQAPLT